ncbi:MAG: DUF4091 domain-containing protein, partial [Clostridia bacterium]|nr:DUF4091 domain-containing protein [Clostridia bacterium]
SNSLPAGDTHVVYPGDEGPLSSVRFESQREGIEDLELLRLLEQRNPKKARAIVRSVIRGFDDYTKDLRLFRAARRNLLQLLRGKSRRGRHNLGLRRIGEGIYQIRHG